MQSFKMVAPCLLGIEGIVAGELRRLDAENVNAQNGRVFFEGDYNILARANIRLACAERVLVEVGSFEAKSFEELFEQTKSLPWENWIGKEDAFPVKGKSLNSLLHSIPDCQSIIKKAIVSRLSDKYKVSWLQESEAKFQIQFFIMKNNVSLMIDSTGEGLHKRGYRKNSNDAPIKETLAAAIADIAHVKPDSTVYDLCCGSGTLLIEAAFHAMRIAPGLNRRFACEDWNIPSEIFDEERQLARDRVNNEREFKAIGYDIDPVAVRLTDENAEKANVSTRITSICEDLRNVEFEAESAVVLCNPPYGERMLDLKQARELYKCLGEKCIPRKGYSYAIISPDEEFEKYFGRKAKKRRKLYNGMIQCQLYLYY